MNKKVIFISVIAIILVITIGLLVNNQTKNNQYIEDINEEKLNTLLNNKETFIIEVMRTSCSACQDFKPKLINVLKKYNLKVKNINTDNLSKEEANNILNKLGVDSTPTVIFIKEGQEITTQSRIIGSVSESKIIEKFTDNGFIK